MTDMTKLPPRSMLQCSVCLSGYLAKVRATQGGVTVNLCKSHAIMLGGEQRVNALLSRRAALKAVGAAA